MSPFQLPNKTKIGLLQSLQETVVDKSVNNLPLNIPRYMYQSTELFNEITSIECTRFEELNCALIDQYDDRSPKSRYRDVHHAIYLKYRDRLQALERLDGYTCLPLIYTSFPYNTRKGFFQFSPRRYVHRCP